MLALKEELTISLWGNCFIIVGQLLRLCRGDEDHAHRTASNVGQSGEAYVRVHAVWSHPFLHRGPHLRPHVATNIGRSAKIPLEIVV